MGTSCESCSGEKDTLPPLPLSYTWVRAHVARTILNTIGCVNYRPWFLDYRCGDSSLIQVSYLGIPPPSADILQNPAMPSYHFSGSPAPFHPASGTASCLSAFIASPGPKGESWHLLQSDRGIEAAQRALTFRKLSCPWPCPTQP